MSREQPGFVETSDAVAEMGFRHIVRNCGHVLLYAVSEADAGKMVDAFIEILNERPKERRLRYVNKLGEDQE